jgi:methanogenic corrinoid protein MtbC1
LRIKRRSTMSSSILEGFLSMKRQLVVDNVKAEIDGGADPLVILQQCQQAMEEVGKRFESGVFFLSELIYSAEIFKAISPLLEEKLAENRGTRVSLGPVVFGTPLGDIHDLGKNLVITFMRANGFVVHDLGVDVPHEKFIDALKDTGAPILAMSGLITPALLSMKEVIEIVKEQGLRDRTFVIIGGAVTTDLACRETGADARGADAVAAVNVCREYLTKLGATKIGERT